MTTEFVRAMAADESVKSYNKEVGDILDAPNEITIDSEPQPENPQQENPAPFPANVPDPEK